MKKDILYFIASTKLNIKNAHALSRSFWIGVFGMVINNVTFFIIWLLFMGATGPINGWTSFDVFGMLGVSLFCFGVCHSFFYGIADLPNMVVKGTFDSVLLAPVNSFLKLSSSAFSVSSYGDLLMGIVVTIFYGIYLKFSLFFWFLFLFSIMIGCIIFTCAKLLSSLIVFFVYDGEVISRQVFEVFLRPGLYPGAIFPNKMKIFFMTIVPTLMTSAVPIYILKGNKITILSISLFVTVFWVLFTIFIYKIAVKKYESGNFLR